MPIVSVCKKFTDWLINECSPEERASFYRLKKFYEKSAFPVRDPDVIKLKDMKVGLQQISIQLLVSPEKLSAGVGLANKVWCGLGRMNSNPNDGEIIFLKAWRNDPSVNLVQVENELTSLAMLIYL